MRKLMVALTTTLTIGAIAATSAAASGVPHGDTDPDHWRLAHGLDRGGACVEPVGMLASCTFSGTADDYSVVLNPGNHLFVSCESTIDFDLNWEFSNGQYGGSRTITDAEPDCAINVGERPVEICAYDPTEGEQEEAEYWIREDYTGFSSNAEPAFGKLYGNYSPYSTEIEALGVEFDQQMVWEGFTVDANYEFDNPPTFEYIWDENCQFPELAQ